MTTPDILDKSCWTNINGPPSYAVNTMEGEPNFNLAVYAKDGIWFMPMSQSEYNTNIGLFRYNQNTGAIDGPIHVSIDLYFSCNTIQLFYDNIQDKLAVLYYNIDMGYEYSYHNRDQFAISVFDCSTGLGLDNINMLYTSAVCIGDLTDFVALTDSQDTGPGTGEAICNYLIDGLHYHNGRMIVFASFVIAKFNYDEWYFTGGEETNSYIFGLEPYSMSNGDYSCRFYAYSIDHSKYPGSACDHIKNSTILDNELCILIDMHTGESNYYSLHAINLNYNNAYIAGADFSKILDDFGNDGCEEQPTGVNLIAAGSKLYITIQNDLYQISQDKTDLILLSSDFKLEAENEADDIWNLFVLNDILYNLAAIDGNDEIQKIDLKSMTCDTISPEFEVLSFLNGRLTSQLDINRSGMIFTECLNGSDNAYFFDSHDQTPRLPVISVDEEAYCYIKVKE